MQKKAYNARIKKFVIVGCSAVVVNFLIIVILIELLGFKSYFLKNLANILAIEISTLYHFSISRLWTWKDAPRKQGRGLVGQFISFNLAALTAIGFRAILFPILEKWGVFYLVNVAIGIGLAASFNFILFDKLIFRREGYPKKLSTEYPVVGLP
jgi:putative flippase GtrA